MHLLQPGYKESPSFAVLHNRALYNFLSEAVKDCKAAFVLLHRAPPGDGHMAYCYLAHQYGSPNTRLLSQKLSQFVLESTETPHTHALRLEALYVDLDLAGKEFKTWEKIDVLLQTLDGIVDYASVLQRIEERQSTDGIEFKDAIALLGARQATLDSRAALRAATPSMRPIYAINQSSDGQQDKDSVDVDAIIRKVLLATTQKHPPSGYPKEERGTALRREPSLQTPNLFLSPAAKECRVDGCKLTSRTRICEVHELQLRSRKKPWFACDSGTKFAFYHEDDANAPRGEWRGIRIRDLDAQRLAYPDTSTDKPG